MTPRELAERLARELFGDAKAPSGWDEAEWSGVEMIERALKEYGERVRRETIEECATVCHKRANECEGAILLGKGEWGSPGYVRDEDWRALQTERDTSRGLVYQIRALAADGDSGRKP